MQDCLNFVRKAIIFSLILQKRGDDVNGGVNESNIFLWLCFELKQEEFVIFVHKFAGLSVIFLTQM